MSFLEEHGIGGAYLGLHRAVKVYVQPNEPTDKTKGTVWIKSSTPATKIVFREYGLEPPKEEGTVWISLYDIDIKFMLERALKVFSNKKEINIEYSRENFINSIDSNKINVLKNKFMKVYSLLGTSRIYRKGKWEWLIGQYWSGSQWETFSNLEINLFFGNRDKIVKKLAPDTGKDIWAVTNHIGTIYDIAVDKDGYIYSASGVTSGELKKISASGQEVWTFKDNSALFKVMVDKDGYVYTVTSTSRIAKISPTGKEIWRIAQSNAILDMICDGKGNIYVSFYSSSRIVKISPDGKEVWGYSTPAGTNPYLAVDNQGYVYTFMNATGNGKALFKKISPSGIEVATSTMDVLEFRFTAIDQQKNIYAFKYNGSGAANTIVKLTQDLQEIWSVPGSAYDLAVDKVGNVYVVYSDSIKKISPDGQVLWSYPITSGSVTSVITEQSPYGAFPFLWE